MHMIIGEHVVFDYMLGDYVHSCNLVKFGEYVNMWNCVCCSLVLVCRCLIMMCGCCE